MTDTRSSPGTNTLREVIAGIVDPGAKFQDIEGVQWSRFEIQRRELAYRKADSILGILPVAQGSPDPVQDTYLVGGPPDLKAMSGSVESDRVIQLHFRRKATDEDRKWLLEAINAKLLADASPPSPVAREWQPIVAALARRLCQLFDSGGESQRSVRARHASAIFQLLNSDAPEYLAEQKWCDASPASYLERGEALAASSVSSTTRGAPRLCSCKASARDGQHMMWCAAMAPAQGNNP